MVPNSRINSWESWFIFNLQKNTYLHSSASTCFVLEKIPASPIYWLGEKSGPFRVPSFRHANPLLLFRYFIKFFQGTFVSLSLRRSRGCGGYFAYMFFLQRRLVGFGARHWACVKRIFEKKRGLLKHRRRVTLVVGFAATDTAKVNAGRANLALRIYRDRARGLIRCRTWIFFSLRCYVWVFLNC
jgi:hypothetical protein